MKTLIKSILASLLACILLVGFVALFAATEARVVVMQDGNTKSFPVAFGTLSTTASDGTVTNTFTVPFAAAPTVILSPTGTDITTTNTLTVTATYFIWDCGDTDSTVRTANWIAIGAQ